MYPGLSSVIRCPYLLCQRICQALHGYGCGFSPYTISAARKYYEHTVHLAADKPGYEHRPYRLIFGSAAGAGYAAYRYGAVCL